MGQVSGKFVAVIATDGVEESELLEPVKALEEAGAICRLISPKAGEIKTWKSSEWTKRIAVSTDIDGAEAEGFDALLIPGGTLNCDKLRVERKVVEFTKHFVQSGKPIFAICHGLQLLIEADAVRGRRLTSVPAIQTDLVNAGANWQNEEVVEDAGLVTSRTPLDLPAFTKRIVEVLAKSQRATSNA